MFVPIFTLIFIRQTLIVSSLFIGNKNIVQVFIEEVKKAYTGRKSWLIVLIVSRTVNLILAYYVFDKLNYAVFSALESPITILVVTLISITLLGERMSIKFSLSILTIIAGVFLVTWVGGSDIPMYAILILVINAFSLTLMSTANEKLAGVLGVTSQMFITSASPLIPLLITALVLEGLPNLGDFNLMIIASIIISTIATTSGNMSSIKSCVMIGSTRTSIVKNFGIVISCIAGVLVLGDTVTLYQWVGIGVITIGVASLTKSKLEKAGT